MQILLPSFKRAASLLFLFVLFTLTSCGDQQQAHFKMSGFTMGTNYHITVLENSAAKTSQQDLQQAVDQQLQLINQQMSTYIDDSELSELNRVLVDEWTPVSPNLFDVLMLSLELGWISNGALDISVGPIVDLWGFGPGPVTASSQIPSDADIAECLTRVDFQALEFDLEKSRVRKRKAISMDLSAIAKGFAVDKLVDLLNYAGYTDFMVEVGGELRLQGLSPRGTPWRIAIEQPDSATLGQPHKAIAVSNVAVATSGDYRNYFEHEGKRYSHTINPKTGYPISHNLASVTVIADTAAYADGLATAINVMGPELGFELAQKQSFAVYLLVKSEQGFVAKVSDAFKPYLE